MLEISKLSVSVGNKKLIKDLTLSVKNSEVHLLMGPNGAGKSSLLRAVMNFEGLKVDGSIKIDGDEIKDLETDQIARKGVFIAYQQPVEIPGVHMVEFIRTAYNLQNPDDKYDPWTFREMFDAVARSVGLPLEFNERNLNEGFSGGEKKKAEIVQMLLLRPKVALLDEIDSGLDLDSLAEIFKQIRSMAEKEETSVLIISHNPNILNYIDPDKVHVLRDGELIESGDKKLVDKILTKGFKL